MNRRNRSMTIVLAIICMVKVIQMADLEDQNLGGERKNVLLENVSHLKTSNEKLEREIDKLSKRYAHISKIIFYFNFFSWLLFSMDQQAELIYTNKIQDVEEHENTKSAEMLTTTNNIKEINSEIFKDYNLKLLNLERNLQKSLTELNSLFANETTYLMVMKNSCQPESAKILDIDIWQEKQIFRLNLMQQKLNKLYKQHDVLETNFENLFNLITEVVTYSAKQTENVEFLEKQVSTLKESSRILDDFIILRNQHLDVYHKCRDGNCQ